MGWFFRADTPKSRYAVWNTDFVDNLPIVYVTCFFEVIGAAFLPGDRACCKRFIGDYSGP